jgi:hypothetical protein
MRNGLHASSNNKHAREEIRLLFPDYEFIKHRPIPFHSNILSSLVFFFLKKYFLFIFSDDAKLSNDLSIHHENDFYHLESHGKKNDEKTIH